MKTTYALFCAICATALVIAAVAPRESPKIIAQDAPTPWSDILGPSQAKLPEPREKLEWLIDPAKAFELAKKENRPVFATVR
ncbi:MAG: hypothetical protein HUU29_06380 [Planctomycetaceae bacterium]|nr:hypothetical protein [Planctomycetaceae bacterium]